MKRPSDSARRSMISRPRCKSSSRSGAQLAFGADAALRSDPAIDWIGASELLISWPRTRTRRCQAWRSSSRSARCMSVTTTSWWLLPSRRKVVRRSSHWPRTARQRAFDDARGRALDQRAQAEIDHAHAAPRRAADEPLGGAVGQRDLARLVDGKDGHVDLGEHAIEQRRGLERAHFERAQPIAERVDLGHGLAQRVVGRPRRPRIE